MEEKETGFDGLKVRYWVGGRGKPVMLMHGSGAGVSALGNFQRVLAPLAERFHVLAFDYIGFGNSDRKPKPPYFDPDLWLRQAQHMLKIVGAGDVGLIGHSVSGALALKLAAIEPRVTKVLTTGTMGTRFAPNSETERVWTFPKNRDEIRRVAETLVYDKSLINEELVEQRFRILHSGDYAAYFSSMFAGDKQRHIDAVVLKDGEINRLSCDVVMMHGRDDHPYPFEETTLALSRKLPAADVIALGRCGHSPALEHPEKLLHVATKLFA